MSWFRTIKINWKSVAKYAAAGALITTVGVLVIPPLMGFTAGGVAAGSIAAAIQSAVFGAAVPAGSWFAIMQSMAATGLFLPSLLAGLGAGTFCGATRLIIDAAIRVYKETTIRLIRDRLARFFRDLMAMGLLGGPELRRILRNPGAIGA